MMSPSAAPQKGLMPPGLGFNAISDKALAVAKSLQTMRCLLGLAGDHLSQQAGLVALYAGDQPVVRLAGRDQLKKKASTTS